MKTLRSYIRNGWHEADGDFATLVDPSSEEAIARASSRGIDFAAVLAHGRDRGGPALRALGFTARAQLLKDASKAIREQRDELLELCRINAGTTKPDGSFDVDGASGTLAYYAALGRTLGDGSVLVEGEGAQVGKTEASWSQHVLVPRQGVAVLINAFNFPVWGFAEKLACAVLAGMPVIVKPATSTSLVTERAVEILVAAGIFPEGAFQFICGGTGDLLDRLGPQDVVAFTGSADTARALRCRPALLAAGTRFNVEADSLNAAVLAPGTEGAAFDLFVRDVAREMTQKTGQKCTAVRRILAAAGDLERVQSALSDRLSRVVTGDPSDPAVTMGPLATAHQLRDALDGVAGLRRDGARVVHGSGERADGVGAPRGRGFFLAPTLLRADDAAAAGSVHAREVFAPVATLLPYDGTGAHAARMVALGGGTLVTSLYGDDQGWLRDFVAGGACQTGRIYVGSGESAAEAPGSGIAFPQALHGGPGRAGGGEELGGLIGVKLYMQRVALQGARATVSAITAPAG